MIYYMCSRCGKKLPYGTKCDCLKERHKEYDKYGRNKAAAKFYQSAMWEIVRNHVLDEFSTTDVFELVKHGTMVKADIVHHIEELKDAPDKALESSNLIPVSSANHNTIHAVYDRSPEDKAAMQQTLRECLEKAKRML